MDAALGVWGEDARLPTGAQGTVGMMLRPGEGCC